MNYGLGALYSSVDQKDYTIAKYSPEMIDKNKPVPEVSAIFRQLHIDNQESSLCCSAYTMANRATVRLYQRTGEYVLMSPAAFYTDRQYMSYVGEGMMGRDSQQGARKSGFIRRDLFPLPHGSYNQCRDVFGLKEKLYREQAVNMRTDGFANLKDVYELAQYIQQEKIGTWMAFDVYSNINNAAPTGIIEQPSGTKLGGHAVFAHDVVYRNGQPYIKFPNTWDKTWGDKGWGYLPANLMREAWGDFDRSPIDELSLATEIIFFTKDIDQSMNTKVIWTDCKTLDFPDGSGAIADDRGKITITKGKAITFLEERSMVCINPIISAIGWTLEYYGDYFIMTKGKTEGKLRKELGLG